MNNQLPPFYVGQRVVAIRDHSQGAYKKGIEYTVTGIKYICCCWQITVGITNPEWSSGKTHCTRCELIQKNISDEWFFYYDGFAPIHSDFQSITFKEAVAAESPLISMS